MISGDNWTLRCCVQQAFRGRTGPRDRAGWWELAGKNYFKNLVLLRGTRLTPQSVCLSLFALSLWEDEIKSQKMFTFLFRSHQQQYLHMHILMMEYSFWFEQNWLWLVGINVLQFYHFKLRLKFKKYSQLLYLFAILFIAKTFCLFKGSANVKTKKMCGCLGLTLHRKCSKLAIKSTHKILKCLVLDPNAGRQNTTLKNCNC